MHTAGDLKNMAGSLVSFFLRSNDESISFLFNGTLVGRREHVRRRNIFELTATSHSLEE